MKKNRLFSIRVKIRPKTRMYGTRVTIRSNFLECIIGRKLSCLELG